MSVAALRRRMGLWAILAGEKFLALAERLDPLDLAPLTDEARERCLALALSARPGSVPITYTDDFHLINWRYHD